MGLTLIEAAKYENRLEHLAVLMTFSEGESPPPGCRESAKGVVAGQTGAKRGITSGVTKPLRRLSH
jgi:hypothetical protein